MTAAEIERIFSITEDLKSKFEKGLREPLLPGRVMALLFEKPSLRTRVSFEAGMAHLGGSSMFLGDEVGFGRRESVADFARVLGQYADVVVVRANRHQTVVEMAKHCTCSVINGLTDFGHPCQALADLYTIRELVGKLEGHTLAWIGDAQQRGPKPGRRLRQAGHASGDGHAQEVSVRRGIAGLDQASRRRSSTWSLPTDPKEAVRDAVAVYTDVWASMGQESEKDVRRQRFAAYQVNAALDGVRQRGAFFMHCLPAHRGEEVTDEVIDGPQSVVIQQAGNRMHVQKGILAWMLGGRDKK